MKTKIQFICGQCAAKFSQWAGHCTQCGAWNSLSEEMSVPRIRTGGYAQQRSMVTPIEEVIFTNSESRMDCGLSELNRVLGGGLVDGSVVLIGGDPGIGKSTLLLQTLANLAKNYKVLYVTG